MKKATTSSWNVCERGDLMFDAIVKTDTSSPWSEERKPIVACCCEVARLEWDSMPTMSRNELEIIEAWTRGEKDVNAAKEAEYRIYYIAACNSYDFDAKMQSAAHVVAGAASSALKPISGISVSRKDCADIVRKYFPKPPQAAGIDWEGK